MQLGSGITVAVAMVVAVAMAVAGSCSSDLTPSLGTSICFKCGPKKQKKKKVLLGTFFYFLYLELIRRIETIWHLLERHRIRYL